MLERKKQFNFLGLFLFALILLGGSSRSTAQGLEVQFEHIGIKQGLSQVTAYCIYEDDMGFIWVGTDDGLNRYDGYNFMVFRNDPLSGNSLSNNSVNSIQGDAHGNLWVGTDQGLNLLDPKTQSFKVHKFDFHDPLSLSSNTVWSMALDSAHALWVGTANGLNRYSYQDSSFTRFKHDPDDHGSLSNNSVNAIYTCSDGSLWIGTNQGLNKWDSGLNAFLRVSIPGDVSRYGQAIHCISEDASGNILVGTNKGLFSFADGVMSPSSLSGSESLKVKSIESDKNGDLWIGTENGLLQYRNGSGKPILHVNEKQNDRSLSDDRVTCVMEDRSGIIWIGTFSNGVNMFYREQQQVFHYDHTKLGRKVFPSDLVNCIEEISPGQFWLGTEAGIGRLEVATLGYEVRVPIPAELKDQSIQKISKQGNRIAIGTDRNGVFLLNEQSEEIKHLKRTIEGDGLHDERISDLCFVQDQLWVGTQGGGISIYDLQEERFSYLEYEPSSRTGLRDNRISALARQGGEAMWIGTSSEGVARYDLKTKRFENYAVGEDSTHTLSSDKILSLLYHSAVLWVGTKGGGLNKIDLLTNEIRTYTTSSGLANNVVYDLRPDEQGRIWMSTNKGVSVIDIENENFINYTDVDGLGNQSFNRGAGEQTSSGEILFGGTHGLDIIRYEDIELNTVLPKVYFTEIEAFDSKTNQYDPELSREIIEEVQRIDLPPGISLITLGFSGINYRKPEKNNYAYRLAGITDEWTFIGDRRYVTFSELAAGTYSLQVKASNNDGRWSEDPTELILNVIPAFYQTNWFKTLLIFAIAIMIFFFNHFRLKRVTKVNKMLEERVNVRTQQIAKERDEKAILLQEIHHRVKNNLQIVNSLLRLQSHYVKDEEALWALDESQNRVMSMAMIHERMYKTENLANINIPDYIRDLCTDIISTYDLSNSVKLDLDIQVEKLNLDTLTPLGLIINEISSNAMKYAFPEERTGTFKVHLEALEPGVRFQLMIGDDGVGMPVDLTDSEQDSLGTTLMDSLSEQLNGKLERLDLPGTVYLLTFEQLKDGVTES